MKRLNNRGKALLLGFGIIVGGSILLDKDGSTQETVQAQTKSVENEIKINYTIENVSNSKASSKLYLSFSQDGKFYFTHTTSDSPSVWLNGFWEIDYTVLHEANYTSEYMMHNDSIDVIYDYRTDTFDIVKKGE